MTGTKRYNIFLTISIVVFIIFCLIDIMCIVNPAWIPKDTLMVIMIIGIFMFGISFGYCTNHLDEQGWYIHNDD